jgi:hypothetical protein
MVSVKDSTAKVYHSLGFLVIRRVKITAIPVTWRTNGVKPSFNELN